MPLWFQHFTYTELLFEVPIGLWAIGQLRSLAKGGGEKKPKGRVYPVMVVWATVCAYTTWICVLEYAKSAVISKTERWMLMGAFVPFGVLCEYFFDVWGWGLMQCWAGPGRLVRV